MTISLREDFKEHAAWLRQQGARHPRKREAIAILDRLVATADHVPTEIITAAEELNEYEDVEVWCAMLSHIGSHVWTPTQWTPANAEEFFRKFVAERTGGATLVFLSLARQWVQEILREP
jgi:hypothetical protein